LGPASRSGDAEVVGPQEASVKRDMQNNNRIILKPIW